MFKGRVGGSAANKCPCFVDVLRTTNTCLVVEECVVGNPEKILIDKNAVIEFPFNNIMNEKQFLQIEKIKAMGNVYYEFEFENPIKDKNPSSLFKL